MNLLDYMKLLGINLSTDDVEFVDGRSSVYSMTETAVPYVSTVPDADGAEIEGLVMLAGMSGTGAKAAMVYGLMAANIVLNQEAEEPRLNSLMDRLGRARLKEDLRKNQ